ncbi:uncharacterized protein [Solanum lycopersicum]|uniref:uncharacterized protein n=1 Tax=Solanum lycopersicum TaxID=4081 RepID=UPI00374930BA
MVTFRLTAFANSCKGPPQGPLVGPWGLAKNTRRNATRRLEEEIVNAEVPPRGDQVPPLEEDVNDDQDPANPPPLTDENISGIGPDEYNRVSACESAKEIWDCVKTAHEGNKQVNESKIDMLTSRYENFKMKEEETIHDMFTKLSSITNELRSMGEPISMTKQVRKVLRILPKSWESKVDAITEAKDLKVLTMDALIGNLKTHEMNQNYNLECPLLKNESKEHQKPRSDKDNRRDLVLGKRDRKAAADLVVKKALAAWGDSSSDSKDPDEPKDVSMVAVHEEKTVFNEMFALMAHTEDEEEDNQVTLLDMKKDLDK